MISHEYMFGRVANCKVVAKIVSGVLLSAMLETFANEIRFHHCLHLILMKLFGHPVLPEFSCDVNGR